MTDDDDELPSVDHLLGKFVPLKEYQRGRVITTAAAGECEERRKTPDSCDQHRAPILYEDPALATTRSPFPSAAQPPPVCLFLFFLSSLSTFLISVFKDLQGGHPRLAGGR